MAAGSLSSAGAAVGTAVMPGIGTAVGALGGALLEGFMGGSGDSNSGPSGPSSAAVAVYGSGLSGDNWSINFRGTQTASPTAYKPFSATGPTASTAAGQGAVLPAAGGALPMFGGDLSQALGSVPAWAWIALAGVVAWKAFKSKK